jgi:hypothetical protein
MRGETFVRFGSMIDQLFNSYWSAEARFATLGAVPPAPGVDRADQSNEYSPTRSLY